jgi:hypothetical protein
VSQIVFEWVSNIYGGIEEVKMIQTADEESTSALPQSQSKHS